MNYVRKLEHDAFLVLIVFGLNCFVLSLDIESIVLQIIAWMCYKNVLVELFRKKKTKKCHRQALIIHERPQVVNYIFLGVISWFTCKYF